MPIELLSPAGTLKAMRHAFAYGADAVYAGLPRYSLRVRNNDFLDANLAIGIAEAHAQDKAFYLAANVLPHNSKVSSFIEDLAPTVALKPDALIMADPGLILLAREAWPDLPIHLSVQANTLNYAAVKFWQRIGISRIILSRELSLDEIAEIRQQCPDMELEVFVHGALCIAYSGRCLLSGYFNRRDPNQGSCTNSCRWKYSVQPGEETVEGDCVSATPVLSADVLNNAGCAATDRHPLADQVYFLREETRPDELLPVMEDEHGTYIMNSKDLRAVEHVQRLVEIGINSLKIEGRTKSHYYVARTAQVYRQALDDALAQRPFNPHLLAVLENLASRGYTDGFYQRHHTQDYQNYIEGASRGHRQQFVGEIDHYDNNTGLAEIDVKNKFAVGDRIELIVPTGNGDFVLDHMEDLNGQALNVALGSGHRVRIRLPAMDYSQAMLARYLDD